MHKVLVSIIIVLALIQSLTLEYTLPLDNRIHVDNNGLLIEYIGWSSSTGSPNVYPGSRQANLLLEIRNDYNESLTDLIGCLILPKGFSPSRGRGLCSEPYSPNGTYMGVIPSKQVFQLKYLLDINRSVAPGQYNVSVRITYTRNSTVYEEILSFNISIAEYPPLGIEIIDYHWEPEEVYPSTVSATLNILLRNNGESLISNGLVRLYLPTGFEPNKYVLTGLTISSNEIVRLRFTGIDIQPNTLPGIYKGLLEINASTTTDDGVEYSGYWNTSIELIVSKPPEPQIEVIDTGFQEKIVYNESMLVDIYVSIRNNGLPVINHILAHLYLPEDARTIDNRSVSITSYKGQVGYGDIISLVFKDINISSSDDILDNLLLELDMVMSYRGARYNVSKTIMFTLNLTRYKGYLKIASIRWLYNGQPAIPLPSSKNIEMQIVLVNYGPRTIKTIIPSIDLPDGIILRDIALQSYGAIPSGEVATLSIKLDVSNDLLPGEYTAMLKLNLIISSDNAVLFTSQYMEIPITIADPMDYMPQLDIVAMNWGHGTPEQVFPGERLVPLYVKIYNYGRYTASDTIARIIPHNSTVDVIEDTVSLGDIVAGELATAVYTVDLRNTSQGILWFTIEINYTITIYGTHLRNTIYRKASVKLLEYEGLINKGLEVTGASWAIEPVFPLTENITYIVSLVNRNPFTIEGLDARLVLPNGFYSRYGENVVEAYVEGPIRPMQGFQVSFTITVGDVEPGQYSAELYVEYVLATGGASKRVLEEYNVLIHVNSPRNSIEYIDSYWLHQTPEPGTYGQYLVITLRNNMYPSMNGIYAEIRLPEGIVFTHTNTSWGKLYPSYIGEQQTLPSIPDLAQVYGLPKDLSSILGAPVETSASRGDYIVFTIPVNIVGNISTGFYNVSLKLFFIDHTGNERTVEVSVRVGVPGGIKYIDIVFPEKIYVKDLVNDVNITFKVMGSGKAYNTYLVVYSSIPIVIPSKTLYYLGTLSGGETRVVNVRLYYNPLYTISAPVTIRYGTIPLGIIIMYTDELGYVHHINTSASLILYPFIKLNIYDVKAVYRDGSIKVSGTITNIGSATAERVYVYIIYGDTNASTFIGDIDPGSEATFSIETSTSYNGSRAYLEITYIDSYDQLHRIRIPLTIEYEEITGITETPKPILGATEYVVIAIVALFLAVTGYFIYRTLKQHEKRLEEVAV